MQAEMGTEEYGVPWWLVLIEGIASVMIGLFLLFRTDGTITFVVQLLGIYWLIVGVLAIVQRIIGRSQERWIWVLLKGILGVLAGLFVLAYPLFGAVIVPSVFVMIIGVAGVVIGVIGLVQGMRAASWAAGISGAVSVLFGFVLLANPVFVLNILVWIIALIAIAGGLLAVFGSFRLRKT